MRFITAVAIIAVVGLFAAPGSLATSDNAYQGTMTPFYTGYVATSAQDFEVFLTAGQTLTAELVWFDDLTDLDLSFIAPGGSCTLLPPDVPCITNVATGIASCGATDGRSTLAGTTETITRVATTTATHTLSVQAALATPGMPVDYVLRVSVDGQPVALGTPTTTAYIQAGTHCRTV